MVNKIWTPEDIADFLLAIPTTLGSDIVLKVGKGWKLKTGVQYQYNTIQKRWEWVPQISISYEW